MYLEIVFMLHTYFHTYTHTYIHTIFHYSLHGIIALRFPTCTNPAHANFPNPGIATYLYCVDSQACCCSNQVVRLSPPSLIFVLGVGLVPEMTLGSVFWDDLRLCFCWQWDSVAVLPLPLPGFLLACDAFYNRKKQFLTKGVSFYYVMLLLA